MPAIVVKNGKVLVRDGKIVVADVNPGGTAPGGCCCDNCPECAQIKVRIAIPSEKSQTGEAKFASFFGNGKGGIRIVKSSVDDLCIVSCDPITVTKGDVDPDNEYFAYYVQVSKRSFVIPSNYGAYYGNNGIYIKIDNEPEWRWVISSRGAGLPVAGGVIDCKFFKDWIVGIWNVALIPVGAGHARFTIGCVPGWQCDGENGCRQSDNPQNAEFDSEEECRQHCFPYFYCDTDHCVGTDDESKAEYYSEGECQYYCNRGFVCDNRECREAREDETSEYDYEEECYYSGCGGYNCDDAYCNLSYGEPGEYDTEQQCYESGCGGWYCDRAQCHQNTGEGWFEYETEAQCRADCVGWICDNQQCRKVREGESAEYDEEWECYYSGCTGYDCYGGWCDTAYDGPGEYPTYNECEQNCDYDDEDYY